MTTDNDETSLQVVEPAQSRITFARKNDLVKTLKRIDKSVDKAIALLEEVMLNPENEQKLRVDCAKTILEKKVQISESVSKDHLARCISESRLILAQQATQQKRIKDIDSSEDLDECPTPTYMPNVILNLETIKEM